VQQNDQRPIAGLDVVQVRVADVGVTLPELGPDVGKQAGGGHEDLPWVGDSVASLRLQVCIRNNGRTAAESVAGS
jgi:hypothetical protein